MKRSKLKAYPLHDYYSEIYRKYDLINRLFTFGRDKNWRRITAIKCLDFKPDKVIDLCCGTGDLAMHISKLSVENIAITGFDYNGLMLNLARIKAAKKQINNIDWLEGDVASMPFENESYDCMTIGFGFRNLTYDTSRVEQHMKEMYRILKPGGYMLILESSVPVCSLIRLLYNLYLKLVLVPLGGIISGSWRAYSYLARSSTNFFSTPELEKLLHDHKFNVVSVKSFFMGAANLTIARKE